MSNITDTKPEPISAKPNWHYDSYFLAQLERINHQKPESTLKKPRKISIKTESHEVETDPPTL
jgi:hypothetical protein